jgi:hypothetical protein
VIIRQYMPRLKSSESSNPDNNGEFTPGVNAMGEREVDYYNAISQISPSALDQTPLHEERAWASEDVEKVRDFLLTCAPYSNPKLTPGFWDHALLAALYAKNLADKVEPANLSPFEAEALNLLHDFGRIISPDQYYRNELLADLFFRKGNNMASFGESKLPDNSKILGLRGMPIAGFEDHTPGQRVTHVADWLGKFNSHGELVTPEEIVDSSDKSFGRYRKQGQWASTRIGMSAIEAGKAKVGNQLFIDEITWLRESGIDLESVRGEVNQEFNSPELQKWLFDIRNAQETISKEVDEHFNRPPIRHIILDIGGVLLENSQSAFCEVLSKKCGVTVEKIEQALAKLDMPELMSNEIQLDRRRNVSGISI